MTVLPASVPAPTTTSAPRLVGQVVDDAGHRIGRERRAAPGGSATWTSVAPHSPSSRGQRRVADEQRVDRPAGGEPGPEGQRLERDPVDARRRRS